jgi:N-glycosylase/DNA lyase
MRFKIEPHLEIILVTIQDDFDLEKIADSGQCFRVKKGKYYRFITKDHVLYIRKIQENIYEAICEEGGWNQVWIPYFDLNRNYRNIRDRIACRAREVYNMQEAHNTQEAHNVEESHNVEEAHNVQEAHNVEETHNVKEAHNVEESRDGLSLSLESFSTIQKALAMGVGLRILRQDPWEMLITFILSQRKNIPAIAKAVETLCHDYGREMQTPYETIYTFPTPDELSQADEEKLRNCGLGYRAPYVLDATRRVQQGILNLEMLNSLDDVALFEMLLTVRGVGKKVANCVCLFGYGRTSRVPIDVWISRAIQEEFQGNDPFIDMGEAAGILQQYVFYYERMTYKTRHIDK